MCLNCFALDLKCKILQPKQYRRSHLDHLVKDEIQRLMKHSHINITIFFFLAKSFSFGLYLFKVPLYNFFFFYPVLVSINLVSLFSLYTRFNRLVTWFHQDK